MKVSLGINTTVATTGAACVEIRTDANTRFRIREIGLSIGIATASVYGVGRPAARGITPTTPIDFLPYDVADAPVSGFLTSSVAWGTGPTAPAAFFRRFNFPAAIGGGIVFTFDDLIIPVSGSLVIWNLGTNATNMNAYFVGDA
jgi:hypothetical protein